MDCLKKVDRLYILSNMIFMHRAENKTAPSIFLKKFVSLSTPIQQISRVITF